jgi:hypothetical protein
MILTPIDATSAPEDWTLLAYFIPIRCRMRSSAPAIGGTRQRDGHTSFTMCADASLDFMPYEGEVDDDTLTHWCSRLNARPTLRNDC